MDGYLSKACWRAGVKLVAGFAVLGAVVGIRVVTATPKGIESEIAELERFEADSSKTTDLERVPETRATQPDRRDLDRMVRCILADQRHFMRAADCGMRGGRVEELPPPEPEDPTAAEAAP